ncbi:molybdopterin-guanine dinucleotide biosynthesis protein [Lacisediminihabitans sp. G11-30]|uniref:Molybdopterin-guanine dinucleotide biosynthesis protein n=1 Tax=Lacisediminihabitans changchengi TaxID=2787634 RepID=A0A934VYI3_9MICO|nr:molybdopterin-guanine dinucleotide biosynthesis protein [Lacisediminihabitans changchengi]MBK4348077.1 molybdopterin-guanine dinucleotide biosynthesis protein [Lacisediminihabitans changchengi]
MLADWSATLTRELGVAGLTIDVDEVLALAGVAARAVVRPAAPLTTFVVGYAAGLAAAAGVEPDRAVREAIATAAALAGRA